MSENARNGACARLSAAISVRTVSYDNLTNLAPGPIDVPDPVRAPLEDFHVLLEKAFPRVHSNLERTVVNRYSLLFKWSGTYPGGPGNEPMVLMAHQDVVPALPDTIDQWTHDPFAGYIDLDLGRIWGRGASDCKSTLMGQLEAVEALLAAGFTPSRDIYLAYGSDEEISGHQGAKYIAEHMETKLGLTGKIGLIVDEGSAFEMFLGVPVANVAVTERGYVDVGVTVETKGGHSSVPPPHTGIGYTALLISAIEDAEYESSLSDENPLLQYVKCYVGHADNPDKELTRAVARLNKGGRKVLVDRLSHLSNEWHSLLTTTQAVDVITGGLKVNALPEKVTTLINHRISVDSSLAETQKHLLRAIVPVAKKHRLDLPTNGKVTVAPNFGYGLEPSPVSPSIGSGVRAWDILEGTIHAVYDPVYHEKVVVSPGMMTGNTDTRWYHNLSTNIYRFAPARGTNIHTVDEYVTIDDYVNAIKFYETLIRNWSA
ncbi:hypothetical protein BC830DRAFT_1160164 [Chytriomyces sp. MP71]|nr:hypothetical protein BC830DRAFT_1160164 [Chytriomyces sp. MP71]